MNWNLAVEKNREALTRILAMLVAMVQMTAGNSNDARSATLPRHLHRFVLRLLRPAEAATRRLIIVTARGLVVNLPPLRPRKPTPVPDPKTIYVLDRVNGSIVSVPIVMPEPVNIAVPPYRAKRTSAPAFPLFDPFKRFGVRRRYANPSAMPSIRIPGDDGPIVPFFRQPEQAVPVPPTPDDTLDAAAIHRRLEAIGRVLDDLPGQAQRMARWQARRDARLAEERSRDREGAQENSHAQPKRRFHRFEPMRPGRPPGWRRKPNHDVYDVLNELHGLAVWARERPDTS